MQRRGHYVNEHNGRWATPDTAPRRCFGTRRVVLEAVCTSKLKFSRISYFTFFYNRVVKQSVPLLYGLSPFGQKMKVAMESFVPQRPHVTVPKRPRSLTPARLCLGPVITPEWLPHNPQVMLIRCNICKCLCLASSSSLPPPPPRGHNGGASTER